MSKSVREVDRVKTKMAANWVATNVIATMQLGLRAPPSNDQVVNGTTEMLNQTWQWRAAVSENSNVHYQRITVTVLQQGHWVARRNGFIWRAQQ